MLNEFSLNFIICNHSFYYITEEDKNILSYILFVVHFMR